MPADVVPIVLAVPRGDIAYVKFIFESYDGIAVTRTLDPRAARIVVLVAPDFLPVARAVVAALVDEVGCRELPAPPPGVDLLADAPEG